MSFKEKLQSEEHLLSKAYEVGIRGKVRFIEDEEVFEMHINEMGVALKDYIHSKTKDLHLSVKIFLGLILLYHRQLELIKEIVEKAIAEIHSFEKDRAKARTNKQRQVHESNQLDNLPNVRELLKLCLVNPVEIPLAAHEIEDEQPPRPFLHISRSQSLPQCIKLTPHDTDEIEATLEELGKDILDIPVFDPAPIIVAEEPILDIPLSSIPLPSQTVLDENHAVPMVSDFTEPSASQPLQTVDANQQLIEVPTAEAVVAEVLPADEEEIRQTQQRPHIIQRIERRPRRQYAINIPFHDLQEMSIVIEPAQGTDDAAYQYLSQLFSDENRGSSIGSSLQMDRFSVHARLSSRQLSKTPSRTSVDIKDTAPAQDRNLQCVEEVEYVEEMKQNSIDVKETAPTQMEFEEEMEQDFFEGAEGIQCIQERAGELHEEQIPSSQTTPEGLAIALTAEERQKRMMNIIYNWNFDRNIKAEDLCMPPINRLNMARTFTDLISLAKGLYVTLRTIPDSLELNTIEKGKNFNIYFLS